MDNFQVIESYDILIEKIMKFAEDKKDDYSMIINNAETAKLVYDLLLDEYDYKEMLINYNPIDYVSHMISVYDKGIYLEPVMVDEKGVPFYNESKYALFVLNDEEEYSDMYEERLGGSYSSKYLIYNFDVAEEDSKENEDKLFTNLENKVYETMDKIRNTQCLCDNCLYGMLVDLVIDSIEAGKEIAIIEDGD